MTNEKKDKEMKEQEPTVVRNVVLLFPGEIAERLIEVNNAIHRKIPSKVVLSGNGENIAFPHMTIYQAKYPDRNLSRVIKTLQKLSEGWSPFPIILQGTSTTLGTVFFDALLSENLTKLHEDVVKSLNSLREGNMIEEELQLPGITEAQRRMVYKYGHSVVMETFQPHMTLARPVDPGKLEEANSLVPKDLRVEIEVNALHFTERGPNGTCPGIVESFPFKRS